ncbi:MAG: TetR/AcrR family transcriptional regulator [Acidimicrobiales bacterium]
MRTELRRPYSQSKRASSTEDTTRRVMSAAVQLWRERDYDQITLGDIAAGAGVSLSTVIRRFATKEGVVEAVLASDAVGTGHARDEVAVGDAAGAVEMIVDDYEQNGDAVVRMLAFEHRIAVLGVVCAAGRRQHRDWVQRVFSPWLSSGSSGVRARRLDELVAATDVYIWKLLRRDLGRSVNEVKVMVLELCQLIVRGAAR